MLDTWIYAKPSAWDAIAPAEEGAIESWHHVYKDAHSGFWLDFTGGYRVYNVLGSEEQIADIADALEVAEPGSVAKMFSWVQGDGMDSLDINPTLPTDVLAVMKPHVVYGEDGNEISSTPATLGAPNWGHVFFGQRERIFAGEFSNEFSEEFF